MFRIFRSEYQEVRSMAQLAPCVSRILAGGAIVFAFGCAETPNGSQAAVEQASQGGTEIHPEDDCDPVTFTAARCNPAFPGTTTRQSFLDQLAANHTAVGWEYGGGDAQVSSGTSVRVDNRGGETHTFSVVANFGGGRNDLLNQLTGNTVVAPECVNGPTPTNVDIPYQGSITVTTGANGLLKPGTYKVQCCIHPWMRTTVVVQ